MRLWSARLSRLRCKEVHLWSQAGRIPCDNSRTNGFKCISILCYGSSTDADKDNYSVTTGISTSSPDSDIRVNRRSRLPARTDTPQTSTPTVEPAAPIHLPSSARGLELNGDKPNEISAAQKDDTEEPGAKTRPIPTAAAHTV